MARVPAILDPLEHIPFHVVQHMGSAEGADFNALAL
jgi:hypothetical protein